MSRFYNNRPFKFGPSDRREYIVSDGELAIQIENDASGNAIYIGKAQPGTATSEDKWQISYQTYDGNNALLTKTWPQNDEANASANYEFTWDNRATYTFV